MKSLKRSKLKRNTKSCCVRQFTRLICVVTIVISLRPDLIWSADRSDKTAKRSTYFLNRSASSRGWIGIEAQEITPEIAESFGLPGTDGALIAGVLRGSPADSGGLRPGDILLAVGASFAYLEMDSGGLFAGLAVVGTLAGLVGVPGRTTYCATKFAQTGFFEALRTELQPQGVDVTIVYPGVVATEIRRNGWNASGERAGTSGLSEEKAMSVEECAGLIVAAMRSRKRDEVMSLKGKLGRWLKLIAPARVDAMARAALNKKQ